jgi:CheY-like chemotaxis protein
MSAPTIIVVEDDPINRKLMVELLTVHGYKVCEAKDGKTAIDIVRVQRPRVILMDL